MAASGVLGGGPSHGRARVRINKPAGFPRKTTLASVELWRGPPFGPSGHGSPPPVKSRLTTLLLIARASTATCEAHEINYMALSVYMYVSMYL